MVRGFVAGAYRTLHVAMRYSRPRSTPASFSPKLLLIALLRVMLAAQYLSRRHIPQNAPIGILGCEYSTRPLVRFVIESFGILQNALCQSSGQSSSPIYVMNERVVISRNCPNFVISILSSEMSPAF